MKKIVYLFIVFTGLLSLNTVLNAQSSLGPIKNSFVDTESESTVLATSNSMHQRDELPKENNTVLPYHDQINTPIRWYAIDNADNDHYWSKVNKERIWIELELGFDISDPEFQAFLSDFQLTKILHESTYQDLTNYIIVDNPIPTKEFVLEMAEAAQNLPFVKFLEPSTVYKSSYTPNDPLWEQQWGPYVTYFDEAWDYGTGGNSMNVVAVMDNACDWNHEDLYDQVWYGWDYVYNHWDIAPVNPMHDHGTHVTGTVAATTGNGIGVAGMVNDTVYFAKVSDDQDGMIDQAIIDGLYDMSTIDRISVLNMSLGGETPSAAIEQACNAVWNSGILILAASGNNGQGFVSWPAAFLSCVAVGSIGADGNQLYLTAYSQYGDQQEITAPGGDVNTGFGIVSALPGNQYGPKEGTSMACPHVTGLAGLMKNLNMNLTNVDLRNILAATAFDYGDEGWDPVFGFGMINAVGAVEAALGIVASTAELSAADVFQLYPNPAQERIFLDLKSHTDQLTVEIYDITGKLVKTEAMGNQQKAFLDIADLNQGVYIIRVQTDEGFASSRFVKS